MDGLSLAIARAKQMPKQEPKRDGTAEAIQELRSRINVLEETISTLANNHAESAGTPIRASADAIKSLLCRRYEITGDEMVSRSQAKHLVWPRHLAMYLCTQLLTTIGTPRIGYLFGGRDHTTVLHARDKIAAMRASDPSLDAELTELEGTFNPSVNAQATK